MTTAHAEELAQLRADAARERDELRAALESRAQVLEESRGELRARAERAERDLDAARAELARMRQGTGDCGHPGRRTAASIRPVPEQGGSQLAVVSPELVPIRFNRPDPASRCQPSGMGMSAENLAETRFEFVSLALMSFLPASIGSGAPLGCQSVRRPCPRQ